MADVFHRVRLSVSLTQGLLSFGRSVGPAEGVVARERPGGVTSTQVQAAFAHLCGAAPIPAGNGCTHRHRLNRGDDRGAPTMRTALAFLAASATTHAPAPTPSAAPRKACRSPKSSAA